MNILILLIINFIVIISLIILLNYYYSLSRPFRIYYHYDEFGKMEYIHVVDTISEIECILQDGKVVSIKRNGNLIQCNFCNNNAIIEKSNWVAACKIHLNNNE